MPQSGRSCISRESDREKQGERKKKKKKSEQRGGEERKYRALFDTASRSCSDTLLTTTVYPGLTHTHTHVTPSNSPLMFSTSSPPRFCCFDFSANPLSLCLISNSIPLFLISFSLSIDLARRRSMYSGDSCLRLSTHAVSLQVKKAWDIC